MIAVKILIWLITIIIEVILSSYIVVYYSWQNYNQHYSFKEFKKRLTNIKTETNEDDFYVIYTIILLLLMLFVTYKLLNYV